MELSFKSLDFSCIVVRSKERTHFEEADFAWPLLGGDTQVLMNILMFGIGLVIYAFYAERRESPVRDALSGDSDKIFPYFVLTELPSGIPGLLVAAVLGSTMSVFSGGINAAATSIYVDVLRNACGWRLTDFRMLKFVQAMTVVLSLLVIGLAFAASAVRSPTALLPLTPCGASVLLLCRGAVRILTTL